LVIYGVLTGESIGQLMLATIIPGILSVIPYMVVVAVGARKHVREENRVDTPALAGARTARTATGDSGAGTGAAGGRLLPAGPGFSSGVDVTVPRKPLGGVAFSVGAVLMIFLVVMGGIFTGLFTATESGAMGAVVALLALVVRSARDGAGTLWARLRIS